MAVGEDGAAGAEAGAGAGEEDGGADGAGIDFSNGVYRSWVESVVSELREAS